MYVNWIIKNLFRSIDYFNIKFSQFSPTEKANFITTFPYKTNITTNMYTTWLFCLQFKSVNSGGNPEIAIALDVVVSADGNSVVAASIPPEEQAHVVYFKPSEIDIRY